MENYKHIIDINMLRYLFSPYVVFIYGSTVTKTKVNKWKIYSDIDLIIVLDDEKKKSVSTLKRDHLLNKFCNLTDKRFDVIWISKSEFEKLVNNKTFKSFLKKCEVLYIGDDEWFQKTWLKIRDYTIY